MERLLLEIMMRDVIYLLTLLFVLTTNPSIYYKSLVQISVQMSHRHVANSSIRSTPRVAMTRPFNITWKM